jgi:hypothetical protein
MRNVVNNLEDEDLLLIGYLPEIFVDLIFSVKYNIIQKRRVLKFLKEKSEPRTRDLKLSALFLLNLLFSVCAYLL